MNLVSMWGGGFGLPETVALGAVALIGYVFGRQGRSGASETTSSLEVARATQIARQLESVAAALRSDLAAHSTEIERFKRTVAIAGEAASDDGWASLREEADRVLEPTLKLVGRVASAYDQIRRQSSELARFSGGRTDSLTGLCNSRALTELLQIELSGHAATGGLFSIAIVGLHPPKSVGGESRSEQQARVLQATELLRPQLRDSDVLARYGIDELVVVMPHTRLYGASVFARRARSVLGDAGLNVSCGLSQSAVNDTPAALLGRADSALYSARAKGDGAQYLHNGQTIREDSGPRRSEAIVSSELVASASPQDPELVTLGE